MRGDCVYVCQGLASALSKLKKYKEEYAKAEKQVSLKVKKPRKYIQADATVILVQGQPWLVKVPKLTPSEKEGEESPPDGRHLVVT